MTKRKRQEDGSMGPPGEPNAKRFANSSRPSAYGAETGGPGRRYSCTRYSERNYNVRHSEPPNRNESRHRDRSRGRPDLFANGTIRMRQSAEQRRISKESELVESRDRYENAMDAVALGQPRGINRFNWTNTLEGVHAGDVIWYDWYDRLMNRELFDQPQTEQTPMPNRKTFLHKIRLALVEEVHENHLLLRNWTTFGDSEMPDKRDKEVVDSVTGEKRPFLKEYVHVVLVDMMGTVNLEKHCFGKGMQLEWRKKHNEPTPKTNSNYMALDCGQYMLHGNPSYARKDLLLCVAGRLVDRTKINTISDYIHQRGIDGRHAEEAEEARKSKKLKENRAFVEERRREKAAKLVARGYGEAEKAPSTPGLPPIQAQSTEPLDIPGSTIPPIQAQTTAVDTVTSSHSPTAAVGNLDAVNPKAAAEKNVGAASSFVEKVPSTPGIPSIQAQATTPLDTRGSSLPTIQVQPTALDTRTSSHSPTTAVGNLDAVDALADLLHNRYGNPTMHDVNRQAMALNPPLEGLSNVLQITGFEGMNIHTVLGRQVRSELVREDPS